jgi:hypothetical protein
MMKKTSFSSFNIEGKLGWMYIWAEKAKAKLHTEPEPGARNETSLKRIPIQVNVRFDLSPQLLEVSLNLS